MKCKQCEANFEGRKGAQYCSNACRQEAYRERHNIEPPTFLPSKKPQIQATRPKEGLGNATEPIKPQTPQERPIRPEWAQLKQSYDHAQEQRQRLYEQRAKLVERCSKALTDKSNGGKIIGSAGGALLGYKLGKDWVSLFLVGVVGGYLGHLYDENQDSDTQKRLERLRKAEAELKAVDSELLSIDIFLANLRTQLKVELKYEVIEVKPMERVSLNVPSVNEVERLAEPEPLRSPAIISTAELADKKYKIWPFTDEWLDFLGEPEHGFHMVVYGKPGQGKSTLTLKFAKYLADNFGKTLYVSSEEGHSKTMADKAKMVQSPYLMVSDFVSVEHVLKEGGFPFVVLDSANNMKLTAADVERIRKVLKERGQSLITIHQATKDGDLRGSQEVEHNADVVIQVEAWRATTTKNRFGKLSELLANPIPDSTEQIGRTLL